MYLNPEHLKIEPVQFERDLPIVTWTYDLTPYGQQRFAAQAQYSAEDWRTGVLQASMLLGAAALLGLVIFAFATHQQSLLWQYVYWPLAAWVATVGALYLHAALGYRVENPYPLTYRLHLLSPGQPDASPLLALECSAAVPPTDHAPAPLALGPLDKLAPFSIARPASQDRDARHQLLAHFSPDENIPRRTVLLATWKEGELEPTPPISPIETLHQQLTWALFTSREEWLDRYYRRMEATNV